MFPWPTTKFFKESNVNTREEVDRLISPTKHNWLLSGKRAPELMHRLFWLSLALGLCTPLWIIIDFFTLPFDAFWKLSILRFSVSFILGIFAYTLRGPIKNPSWKFIWQTMMGISITLAGFHITAALILDGMHLNPVIARSYEYLPFVMSVAVAMLPLTLIEGFFAVLPGCFALATVSALRSGALSYTMISDIWLFGLVSFGSLFTSIMHFRFLDTLSRQAIRDHVSGAFSRASGEELLDLQFLLSARASAPMAVALCDVEGFRMKNAKFGRDRCDAILAKVASKLVSDFRKSDMIVRWGGDELLLIMPNTNAEGAKLAIDRILAVGFGKEGDETIEVSVGMSERMVDDVSSWIEMVLLAEKRKDASSNMGGGFLIGPT